jgi:hypothetical protein
VTAWAIWRYRPDLRTAFAFLPAASLVVMPYVLSYHYLIVLVTAIPLLLAWRPALALPLYVLTLTPLLRLEFGREIAWIDIIFPVAIWALLLHKMRGRGVQAADESTVPAVTSAEYGNQPNGEIRTAT